MTKKLKESKVYAPRFIQRHRAIIAEIFQKRLLPNIMRFHKDQILILWGLAAVIGIIAALAAIVFRGMISLVQFSWISSMSENVASAVRTLPWWQIIAGPTIGGAIVGIALIYLLPHKRTGGVADVIEAREFSGRGVGLRHGLYSALVSALSLGAGASAGREGPVVHLGACLGMAVTRYFGLCPGAWRTLMAAGVASAVAASFNAPIAGVLFAHEIVLRHYAISAFVPIVIASVLGAVLSRWWFGDFAAFEIPSYQITSYWEVPAFVLLGLACAVVAIVFQFAMIAADWIARNVPLALWARPPIGGFLIGVIGVFFPHILGVGYEATDAALNSRMPLILMLALIVLKIIATSITLASRFGGGIFSPALYLGAMTGGAFGVIAASVFPELASSDGLYAIVGMGAVAAAVLNAPISSVTIVFELTGGYAFSIALLIAVSISVGLCQAVHGRSFFYWQLERRDVVIHSELSERLRAYLTVKDCLAAMPVMEHEQDGLERNKELPIADLSHAQTADNDTAKLVLSDTLGSLLDRFDYEGWAKIPIYHDKTSPKPIRYITHIHALNYFSSKLKEATKEAEF